MTYLMIHDIRQEYFHLNLDRYHLTFDDGLFSQYYYYPLFKQHPHKITFFITTGFIRPGPPRLMYTDRHRAFLKSKNYMYRTFIDEDYDHFMTTEELQELAARPNVHIGIHSHFHDIIPTHTHASKKKPISKWKLQRFGNAPEIADNTLSIRSKLAFQGLAYQQGKLEPRSRSMWTDYIRYDTEQCLAWMDRNLGLTPNLYCFPFNEFSQPLIDILKTYGFNKFFAARSRNNAEIIGRVDIDSLVEQA